MMVPVGQPGKLAIGSFSVNATVDTGPILGRVKQKIDLNISNQ